MKKKKLNLDLQIKALNKAILAGEYEDERCVNTGGNGSCRRCEKGSPFYR